MTEQISLWSYLLWFIGVSLELLILRVWFERKSLAHLTMLPAFVGFVLFADIVRFAILESGAFGKFGYAYSWWWAQVGETLLRALLAIQILDHVIKWNRYRITVWRFSFEISKIKFWGCYAALCVMAIFWLGLPTDVTRVFIRTLTVADLVGGALVAFAILWPSIHWPKGYTTVAFGLFFSLAADLALFIMRFSTGTKYLTLLRVLLPVAFIVVLLLFLLAALIHAPETVSDAAASKTNDSANDSGHPKRIQRFGWPRLPAKGQDAASRLALDNDKCVLEGIRTWRR